MSSTLDSGAGTGHAEAHGRRAADVVISGVSVSYDGTTPAVHDADLTVPQGSTTALLGPSGCGKTSLLRAVAGLERPVGGTISIGGRAMSGPRTWVPPQRRHVGMVFQDGALFPHLSVAENIEFGLKAPGLSMGSAERRDRVGELLDIVELGEVASRLPETLSGGQQQRVALARSLAPRPSVLLLDEPFSALDASLRVQVRGDVGRILREIGVTTIFVTHDQDEAFVLGDSVAVMRDGRIEQVGTPDELYRTPASPWVAAFVGEANFVAGRFADAVSADSDHHGNEIPAGHARTLLGSVPVISPGNLEAGGDVTVLIRPEQIALRTGDCAEIVNVEYYGHDVRYELRLHDGSTLAARTKATDLHERGETVCVHFSGAATEAWSAEVAAAGQNPLPNG